MRFKGFIVLGVALVAIGIVVNNHPVAAQGATALAGGVASPREGKMEGVVVSARREGAIFTVSVVSDKDGEYAFPRANLVPGKYNVAIRAAGYDLVSAPAAEVVAGKTATLDLKLDKTKDLASQLSTAEWIESVPASLEVKEKITHQLLSCAYCHSHERIMKSRHSADEFYNIIQRMASYFPDGAAVSRDGRGRAIKNSPAAQKTFVDNDNWGVVPGIPKKELGQYFASYNLSGGRTSFAYDLKTLPRPTGKGTKVIITQYDMPRKDTVPHDSDLDSKGRLWYADQSAQFIGVFDPKTESFNEVPLPPVNPGSVPGAWDVQVDKNDNVWFPMRTPEGGNALTRYEPATGKLTSIAGAGGQFLSFNQADGSVWAGATKIDVNTATIAARYNQGQATNAALVPPGSGGYHNVVDSKGRTWVATYRGPGGVIGFDTAKNEVMWFSIPGLGARRGKIDANDVYWFGEYMTDKLSMFDTKTGKSQRWDMRKWSTPYTSSVPDKNGRVYAPSNMTERLTRLDPKTGEMVEYLMPTDFDTKKIAIESRTDKIVLWFANTRNARVTKVEPLD